eukprot:7377185-Prymnesium_polylepis.1
MECVPRGERIPIVDQAADDDGPRGAHVRVQKRLWRQLVRADPLARAVLVRQAAAHLCGWHRKPLVRRLWRRSDGAGVVRHREHDQRLRPGAARLT